MEIKDISLGGKLRVDHISIMLRNDIAKNVEVTCDVTVGSLPTSFGGAKIHFEPDQELIDFLNKKIEQAITDSKITSNMAYLEKTQKDIKK